MRQIGMKTFAAVAALSVTAAAAGFALQGNSGVDAAPATGKPFVAPTLEGLRAETFASHYARIAGMGESIPTETMENDAPIRVDLILARTRLSDLEGHLDQDEIEAYKLEGRMAMLSGQWSDDDVHGYTVEVIRSDDRLREAWQKTNTGILQLGGSPDFSESLATHAMAAGAWQGYFGTILPRDIAVPVIEMSVGQHGIHAEGIVSAEMAVTSLRRFYPQFFQEEDVRITTYAAPEI